MRIHIFSDLHVDIDHNEMQQPPNVDADVIVCAGDAAAPGTLALRIVRDLYPDRGRPLIYVPGNHDFYSFYDTHNPSLKTTWEEQHARMPEVAADLGITLLNDASVEIGDVLFIGATLWTDFLVRPPYVPITEAMRTASKSMNDYRAIKVAPGRSRDMLKPAQTIAAHKTSVAFIEKTLAERPDDQAAVVVTHHAPSPRSLLRWPMLSELDYCYASAGVERLMTGDAAPQLWLHGHIHRNRDYTIGDCRVIANPRGYPHFGARENPDFDPAIVVELEPRPTYRMKI
ncbi:putative phosphodiesterase [Bradyrhizobium sp. GM0.4]